MHDQAIKSTRRILTGAELRFAAENKVPVFYEEKYYNPDDRHMNFHGKCVMEKAPSGYYIGKSDISPDEFEPDALVEGVFPEGTFRVAAVAGKQYCQGWHVDEAFRCPVCSGATIVEDKRGWWCADTKCKLGKHRNNMRKPDKYRPFTSLTKKENTSG